MKHNFKQKMEGNIMTIIREGKEIELTKEELFKAYMEQENVFDIQNIEDNMENYLDESEYDLLKDNKQFIDDTASELKRNQDKYDMDYENAIREAFDDTKLKYLKD